MRLRTHLGRPLVWSEASNRWVAGLTLGGAVAGLLLPGDRSPVLGLFETAATVFLAWALTRELDPDHPGSAGVAAVLAGSLSLWTGETSLMALAGLMLAARILTRSTGAWPLLTDIVAAGVFVGVLARTPLAWAAGLALAAAVALDTGMTRGAPSHYVWLAGAIGVAVTLTAVLSHALPRSWARPTLADMAVGVVALVLGWTAPLLPLNALSDFGGARLDVDRLKVARRLTIGALVLGVVAGGAATGAAAWPAWATVAVLGVADRVGRNH